MPPKKPVDAQPELGLDLNPFGVFVCVDIPCGNLKLERLEIPEGAVSEGSGTPKLHLSVVYPGENLAPLVGVPTEGSTDGFFPFQFKTRFRRELGEAALLTLLNSTVGVNIHDSKSGAILASASLDLLGFGLGEHTLELKHLSLQGLEVPILPRIQTPTVTAGTAGKAAAAAAATAAAAMSAPSVRICGSAILPALTITLLKRDQPLAGSPEEAKALAAIAAAGLQSGGEVPPPSRPVSGTKGASTSRPGTNEKKREALPSEPGKDPLSGITPPVLDESALPPLEPFRYLPEGVEEPSGLNVVELSVWGPGGPDGLPPSLLAAHELAAGKLTFSAALQLPSPGPLLMLPGGVLITDGTACQPPAVLSPGSEGGSGVEDGSSGSIPGQGPYISWGACRGMPCIRRAVLTQAGCESLLAVLEDNPASLGIELVRTMAEDKALGDSPAVAAAYHALAPLPGTDILLEAAQDSVPSKGTSVAQLSALAPLQVWPAGMVSSLPPPPPAPPKMKPIEELPVSGVSHTAGTYSAWQAHGCALRVRLHFARPLVPVWEPPPAPVPSLQECVPQRDLNPPLPEPTPEEDMSAQAMSLLKELALVFKQHEGEVVNNPDGKNEDPVKKFKPLIRALNASGAYQGIRDKLKKPLLRVVKERFGLSGSMEPSEMSARYADVYASSCECSHTALSTARDTSPTQVQETEGPPTPTELRELLVKANESVAENDYRRARALHLKRCLDKDNADVHLDRAQFEARAALHSQTSSTNHQGSIEAALTSVKRALEINPAHPQALLMGSCLALELSLIASKLQPQVAEEAFQVGVAMGHALLWVTSANDSSSGKSGEVVAGMGASMAWAVLALLYEGAGKTKERGACLLELKRRERATSKVQHQQQGVGHERREHSNQEGVQQPDQGENKPSQSPDPTSYSLASSAAGMLPLWSVCTSLGLPGAAAKAQTAALTTFCRSSKLTPRLFSVLASEGVTVSKPPEQLAAGTQVDVSAGRRGKDLRTANAELSNLLARTALLLAQSIPEMGVGALYASSPASIAHAAVNNVAEQGEEGGKDQPERGMRTGSSEHRANWLRIAQVAVRHAQRALESATGEDIMSVHSDSGSNPDSMAIEADQGEHHQEAIPDQRAVVQQLRISVLAGDLAYVQYCLGPSETQARALEDARSCYQSALQLGVGLERAVRRSRKLTGQAGYLSQQMHQSSSSMVDTAIAWVMGEDESAWGSPSSPEMVVPRSAAMASLTESAPHDAKGSVTDIGAGSVASLLRAALRCGEAYLRLEGSVGAAAAADIYASAAYIWPGCSALWTKSADAALACSPSQTEVAMTALQQANLCDPLRGEAWAQLASASYRDGNIKDGNVAMERALALNALVEEEPQSSLAAAPSQPVELLQAAAWSCSQSGEWGQAVSCLRRALELGASTFQVHEKLANALFAQNQVVEARKAAQEAAKHAASDIERHTAAELLRRAG